MTHNVKKDEIIAVRKTTNSAYLIRIGLVKGFLCIDIGLNDAQNLGQILCKYDPYHQVQFVSDSIKRTFSYLVAWRQPNKLHIVGIDNSDLFILSADCADRLYSCLGKAMTNQNPPKKPFLISETPGSACPIHLVFDNQLFFDLTLQTAREIADFLGSRVPTGFSFNSHGNVRIWFSGYSCFENTDDSNTIDLSEPETKDLIVDLRASICSINAAKSTPIFVTEKCLDEMSKWKDIDPLAGAKKRTDDNLAGVFG